MFKPGDVVILKSGGPLMTIEGEKGKLGYPCRWFEGNDPKRGFFPPETIEKYTGPSI